MDAATVELTELEKLEVTRVDAVSRPANGFPVLLMKGIPEPFVKADGSHAPMTGSHAHQHPAFGGPDGDGDGDHGHDHDHDGDADHHHSHADMTQAKALARAILADLAASPAELLKAVTGRGKVDEGPDVALGNQILALLGQAMAAEAAEVAAGQAGEVRDIMELACAAEAVRCWRDGEQAVSLGDVMPASMLMQSAAGDAAKGGDAPGDGSKPYGNVEYADPGYQSDKQKRYPLDTEKHIRAAWSYVNQDDNASKYSSDDLARVKGKIKSAMRGIGADVDDDASKAEIAQEVTSVDTVTKGSDDLDKAVADAVTKATAPLEERLRALGDELAKVKAQPIPGGPVMSAAAAGRKPAEGEADHVRKAENYEWWAERVSDPVESDRYRQLAARERAKITTQ